MIQLTNGKPSLLKQHHHVRLDAKFKADCRTWATFLGKNQPYGKMIYRPFQDLQENLDAQVIGFFTDASAGTTRGFGCYYDKRYTYGVWENGFIDEQKPSIAFLELYALCVGVFTWTEKLAGKRLTIHCDNQSVVAMVNHTTSGCENCMWLIRELVLQGLEYNFRVFARYIDTKSNFLADALS